jgi:hypothetical protein
VCIRLCTATPADLLEAPRAPRRPRQLEAHGDARQDAYYWLRDDEREDPNVIAHLEVPVLGCINLGFGLCC